MGGIREWTDDEDRVVRDVTRTSKRRTVDGRVVEMMPLLPGRSKNSIRNRIVYLGVNSRVGPNMAALDDKKRLTSDEKFRRAMARAHPEMEGQK